MKTKFDIGDKVYIKKTVPVTICCDTCRHEHVEYKDLILESKILSIHIFNSDHIYYKCKILDEAHINSSDEDSTLVEIKESDILESKTINSYGLLH